jgi:hypothetical protein
MQQWGKSDAGGEGAVARPVGAPVKRRQLVNFSTIARECGVSSPRSTWRASAEGLDVEA